MPGPAARPKQVRREEMTRRLLPVVDGLLEDGTHFGDLHVEQIIAAAGIARSTFYTYYDDKNHLLQSLSSDLVTELVKAGQVWMALSGTATQEDLRGVLDALMSTYRRNGRLVAAIAEESMRDRRVRREFRRLYQAGSHELLAHIREGQEHGWVHAELDADFTALWLMAMLERGLYGYARSNNQDDFERHIQAITVIIWRTLYAGAPGRVPAQHGDLGSRQSPNSPVDG